MAIFVAEQRKHNLDPHWLAVLVMAAMFSAFLLGMAGSSLQFATLNTTTIENLSRKSKVWQLAIHIPNPPGGDFSLPYRVVTYDANGQVISNPNGQQPLAPSSRTFAILHSKPGENPWDLGPLRNFKSVMGERWYQWFLPLKQSPCTNHDRGDCQYETGSVVDRMRREVGLLPGFTPPQPGKGEPDRRRRRRRRHRRRRPLAGQSMELEEDQRTEEERRKRHHVTRRSREDSGIDQGDSTVDNV
ncbi:MAG: hypothetical protein Q9214_006167 [Letrouitia sp. 1 TL-2023]